MFSWDDVRCFLAVARHGSTLAAAKALSVNQSTVQRRIAELETGLGRALVQRHATGYRLTAFGQDLLPYAERIESAAEAFERRKAVLDRIEFGVVRITCPEPVVIRIVKSGLVERFQAKHPGLQIEFLMRDHYVDLAKGEADVALRSGDTDDGVLVGRKIADSIWSVYASQNYVQQHGQPETPADIARHAVVALDGPMAGNRAASWLAEIAPHADIAARVSSVLGLVSAAKSGLAVVPMPIALGDNEPDLVRLFDSIPALTRSWRVLAHPDARDTPGVAAFFAFLADEKVALKAVFTG